MEIKPLHFAIEAKGHTPQYRMHKYFARRPYNVLEHLIEHYSRPGDIVLDCFCGGGVTVFESAALGRKPIGVDLNPLATFITRMQMFQDDITQLESLYHQFLTSIEEEYRDWYQVEFGDDEGTALWTEWVYLVQCPHCGQPIALVESNKISNGVYRCSNDTCIGNIKGVKRVSCTPCGSRPLRVCYRSQLSGEVITRPLELENMPIYRGTPFADILKTLPHCPDFSIPKEWDRTFEDKLYEKGVSRYRDFFTLRNYTLNCLIFHEILALKSKQPEKWNEYLYFLFSSSLRYTNKMARVTDHWEGGKPTTMDKHAFWLPNEYIETNILEVLNQRAQAIVKGCTYSAQKLPVTIREANSFADLKEYGGYLVLNQSSSSLPFPDGSVDVVITDPPYGSNVQYAELSTIWNAWYAVYSHLDSYIYKKQEAVVNRKKHYKDAKSTEDYEQLLYEVYAQVARVLKPDGYLVFTFNNKNIKVWIAMLKAVARAGFYLPEEGILFQDYIESYKNTTHLRLSGNIQGDFIYSFQKGRPTLAFNGPTSFAGIIDQAIDQTIVTLFAQTDSVTTAQLYEELLRRTTKSFMQYIVWSISNELEMDSGSNLSNDYLESRLRQILTYQNGVWRRKGQ